MVEGHASPLTWTSHNIENFGFTETNKQWKFRCILIKIYYKKKNKDKGGELLVANIKNVYRIQQKSIWLMKCSKKQKTIVRKKI